MSNGDLTWRNVARTMSDDANVMAALVEVAQAPEKVSRNPVQVYLDLVNDIGDEGFAILPEPNSNQEKKTDGLGFHIGDNMRAEMDAKPTRHWDKYFYKASTGETVSGSVYVDIVKETDIGRAYADASEILKAWNGKEVKPETLQQTVTIDGDTVQCSMTDGKTRGDLASMLDQRVLNMANALRRIVGMWRQIKDIQKRLSEFVEVSFVYRTRDLPTSGLAGVKKPIMLLELNCNKESPQYGQRTGFMETFAPTVFNQLDVDKAVAADAKLNKYQVLKDSRKERATAKPGAGASTKDKDKAAIEGRVTSNNLLQVMSNLRVFTEDEDSKRHLANRLAAMKPDDRAELIASMLQWRDWTAWVDTPDNRAIAKAYSDTATERAVEEAQAKAKADAEIKKAEAQPTMKERNAEEYRKQELERQNAALAQPPSSESVIQRKPATTTGRRAAR